MTIVVAAHGGGCCGMRHVRSISYATTAAGLTPAQAITAFDTAVSQVPHGRTAEVILTNTQMTSPSYAPVLARMAELGFVLVNRYLNDNSGNENFVFHRTAHLKALVGGAANRWNGLVRHPGLNAELPAVHVAGAGEAIRVGDIVSVSGLSTSHARGMADLEVIRIAAGGTAVLRLPDGRESTPNSEYVTVIRRGNPAPGAPINYLARVDDGPEPLVRHLPSPAAPPLPVEVPAPVPVVEVFSTFHNIYRDGRVGAGYDSELLATEARRGQGEIRRRTIRSDGTFTWSVV